RILRGDGAALVARDMPVGRTAGLTPPVAVGFDRIARGLDVDLRVAGQAVASRTAQGAAAQIDLRALGGGGGCFVERGPVAARAGDLGPRDADLQQSKRRRVEDLQAQLRVAGDAAVVDVDDEPLR